MSSKKYFLPIDMQWPQPIQRYSVFHVLGQWLGHVPSAGFGWE